MEHAIITGVWENNPRQDWVREQSHWRGVGRWSDDRAWQNVGLSTRAKLEGAARMANLDFPENPSVLEWGPGGGSNLFAFRDLASTYYGVDISQSNLAEAARMLSMEVDASVEFAPILLEGPPESLPKIPPVDLFLSTACFQHFPSKDYGASVLRAVRRSCKHRALGIIQIRFDNGNPRYAGIENVEDYAKNPIRANSYPIEMFWTLADECGFYPMAVAHINPNNNYATFYLIAK